MSKKILLVDDDTLVLEDLAEALGASGYRVWATESTEQAVRLISEVRPDVVVTDYRMPGMDGLSLLERVRELVPTAMMVVHSGTASRSGKTAPTGDIHWVAKSAGHGVLLKKLRELLEDQVDSP